MASKLRQMQSKACQASQFVAKNGGAYYKQLLEQNKQYIQEPPTVEKCELLSKQLFYTRLARLLFMFPCFLLVGYYLFTCLVLLGFSHSILWWILCPGILHWMFGWLKDSWIVGSGDLGLILTHKKEKRVKSSTLKIKQLLANLSSMTIILPKDS